MARVKKPGKRLLAAMAKDESDPEWRRWFQEVATKKKEAADPKRKPYILSEIEKEAESVVVKRRAVDPEPLKKFLKTSKKRAGSALGADLEWIRSAWNSVVDAETATETAVYAFKNGTLTISVFSSSLLQEIRQFHQAAILADLRDIWQASQPLVSIQYRLGKR